MKVKEHLMMLGTKVQDKVTGMTGIVVSVSFDLSGCMQCFVNRGLDKDGKMLDGHWVDLNRLDAVGRSSMTPPTFDYETGSFDKAPPSKW